MYVIYYERTSACISKNCHSCQKRKNKNKRKKQNKKKKNNQKQFHKVAFK